MMVNAGSFYDQITQAVAQTTHETQPLTLVISEQMEKDFLAAGGVIDPEVRIIRPEWVNPFAAYVWAYTEPRE
jgi:hypothetical protein